jgi:hypothetical protein
MKQISFLKARNSKMRTIFVFIILSFILVSSFWVFWRENLYASASQSYESQDIATLSKILDNWQSTVGKDADYSLFKAREQVLKFAEEGSSERRSDAIRAFRRAALKDPVNPSVSYEQAQFYLMLSGLRGARSDYESYISLMRETCRKDPNNYYYYSVFFEDLITFLTDMKYLRHGFNKESYLKDLSFAYKNYVRLKQYYASQYQDLLKFHLSDDEYKLVTGHAPMSQDS